MKSMAPNASTSQKDTPLTKPAPPPVRSETATDRFSSRFGRKSNQTLTRTKGFGWPRRSPRPVRAELCTPQIKLTRVPFDVAVDLFPIWVRSVVICSANSLKVVIVAAPVVKLQCLHLVLPPRRGGLFIAVNSPGFILLYS